MKGFFADSLIESSKKVTRRPIVVSLCDRTAIMLKPWVKAGFECWAVDLRHSIRKDRIEDNLRFVWGDVRTWCPPDDVFVVILFCFPPCTHVAVCDAQDFRTKGTAMLRDSLEIFSACEHAAKWNTAPYMIENPVGKFSDHMGPPNHVFQPWEFGDLWLKKTHLWTGNGFRMPKPLYRTRQQGVVPKIWKATPSEDRADMRSETPPKFAQAVFDANQSLVKERILF